MGQKISNDNWQIHLVKILDVLEVTVPIVYYVPTPTYNGSITLAVDGVPSLEVIIVTLEVFFATETVVKKVKFD